MGKLANRYEPEWLSTANKLRALTEADGTRLR